MGNSVSQIKLCKQLDCFSKKLQGKTLRDGRGTHRLKKNYKIYPNEKTGKNKLFSDTHLNDKIYRKARKS